MIKQIKDPSKRIGEEETNFTFLKLCVIEMQSKTCLSKLDKPLFIAFKKT